MAAPSYIASAAPQKGRIVKAPPPPPTTDPFGWDKYFNHDPGQSIAPDTTPPQGPHRTDVLVPTDEPLPVIYGGVGRVGGQVWYAKVDTLGRLVVVYAICHGPINSITNITIEGKSLATFNMTNGVDYNVYTGTGTQTLDSLLSAAESTFTKAFPFVAYAVLRFPKPSFAQPAPDWKSFLCDVQGMLVRDPRENRFLWSSDLSNAAWVKASLTVAANGTAPDGSVAWNLTDATGAAFGIIDQGAPTVANDTATHRCQFRVKKTSGGTSGTFGVTMNLTGGSTRTNPLRLNTDTGAILNSLVDGTWTVTTDPYDSNWWFVQGALANNASGNTTLTLNFIPAVAPNGSASDTVTATGTATVGMMQRSFLGSVFPGYALTRSSAIVGDPTLVTRFYSDNVDLCIADFMTSPLRTADDGSSYVYGAGIPDTQLDWYATVSTCANDCDVLLADAVTKRFTMGIVLNAKLDWVDHVTQMRAHAQILNPIYNNGLFQIVMDKAQNAAGVSLTDTGAGANIVGATPLRVKDSDESPTHVPADFINPAANYKDDTVYDDDPGLPSSVDLVLPRNNYRFGVIPADQAKRLCKYLRKRLAKDKSGTLFVLHDGGIQLLPGIRVPVTYAPYGWTAKDCIVADLRSSQTPEYAWEVDVEEYDANVYDDTQFTITPSTPPVGPSPYDTPPEIVDPIKAVGPTTASIYWSPPLVRSTTTYGTSAWVSTGHVSFDGTKINDGNLIVQALNWNSGASQKTLRVDLGSAKKIREWWFGYTGSRDYIDGSYFIEYSDNDSTWTSVTGRQDMSDKPNAAGGMTYVHYHDDMGAHRYWRLRQPAGQADSTVYCEVWPREYTSEEYSLVREYRVYALDVSAPPFTRGALYATIPARVRPTASNPLDLNPIAKHIGASSPYDQFAVDISVVSTGGKESVGCGAAAAQVPTTQGLTAGQFSQTITLNNGVNSNINTIAGRGLIEIIGPTAGFSIGGFTNPQPGEILRISYQGGQAGVLLNEDLGSTAANRINNLGAPGNINFAAGAFYAELEYSAVASRFILKAARDSAGIK